jgi:hypothetical protein
MLMTVTDMTSGIVFRRALDKRPQVWLAVFMQIKPDHWHVSHAIQLTDDDFTTTALDVAIDHAENGDGPFITPCDESTCAPRD